MFNQNANAYLTQRKYMAVISIDRFVEDFTKELQERNVAIFGGAVNKHNPIVSRKLRDKATQLPVTSSIYI